MMKDELIERYISLLKEYNETTNIYSKKAYGQLDFHIRDSIRMAELIGNEPLTVFDFGSGSGLPSIPIAIMNPNNTVVAFESKSRKSYFLEHAADNLGLENYSVRNVNIVEYGRAHSEHADIITAKAFAPYEKMETYTKYFYSESTKLIIPISRVQFDIYSNLRDNSYTLLDYPDENMYYILK